MRFLELKARPGLWLLLAWVAWPLIAITADTLVRSALSAKGCPGFAECYVPAGAIDLLAVVAVPACLTVWYWRSRRRPRSASGGPSEGALNQSR